MTSWRIVEGDALERLRELPAESVQCCITSPPYFGLRCYGVDGQTGLESTPDLYVARLVEVFREVRRVLRPDGTLWLNMGDSYATSPKGNPGALSVGLTNNGRNAAQANEHRSRSTVAGIGVKSKDLLGIPWLLAFALRADGWYLRSDIIWAKPNPMPESVTDRPTSAHEHVFLLAKSRSYFYDADAIREPHARLWDETNGGNLSPAGSHKANGTYRERGGSYPEPNPAGRNRRNVWEIATQPYPQAHFATFPTKLVEPCVLAGSSPMACGECGAPWVRVVDVGYDNPGNRTTNGSRSIERRHLEHGSAGFAQRLERRVETVGWQPSCPHDDNTGHSLILDPFAGTGTVGLVALRHNRSFTGIELSPAYCEMARNRIRQDAPLLNTPAEAVA